MAEGAFDLFGFVPVDAVLRFELIVCIVSLLNSSLTGRLTMS